MLKQQYIKEFVKFESQGRFHKESDKFAGLTNRNGGSYGFYHITSLLICCGCISQMVLDVILSL